MVLAFRLYGDFHWPPNAGKPLPPDQRETQLGAIEIHIEPRDEHAALHAKLCWIPRSKFDPIAKPAPATQSIFDVSAEEWFSKNKDGGAIWLSKAGTGTVTPDKWAILRGAFLFEQYGRKDKDGNKTADLDVQWPLVTQCEYEASNEVYSVLGIYRRAEPLMYFNFHLPLPVRRTSLAGSTSTNSSFFPFSAVFDLTPASTEKLTEIAALFAGWQPDDLLPAAPKKDDPWFAFEGNRKPETMRLGRFGFSEYGKTDKTEFAVYGLPSANTGRYWPLNRQSLLQDILWRYGFGLDYKKIEWLKSTNSGLRDSSLRFVNPADLEGSTRHNRRSIIYRTSVVQTGAAPPDSDLQTDDNGLRLRLRDELGGRYAIGTQFGANDTNAGEAANEIEGWLRVGRSLSADCELSWDIAPQDIWTSNRSDDWRMTVAIWLHWRESIADDEITGAPALPPATDGSHNNDFKAGLLAQANFTFDTARASLEPGEAGRPHSFLPELSAGFADKEKSVRFALYGSPLPATFESGVISWGRAAPTKGNPSPPWRRPPMRLSLAHHHDVIANAAETSERLTLAGAKATFFQKGDGLGLVLSHDPSWPPRSADTIEDSHPFFTSYMVDALPKQEWHGRLGSLQFSGVKQDAIEGDAVQRGHLRIGGRGAHLGLGLGAPVLIYPDGRIAAEIRLAIPAARVEPVGVDVARADRSGRPGPLLIELGTGSNGKATANLFWLTAVETLSPTQDRLLEASVTENSQEIGARSYMVLESEPFSIFRFTHQPLSGRGQADAATVAFYSSDDRIWQYRQVADFYHYVFPPQSIGESADKPRRLEIHDLPDGSSETPPRPYPVGENGKPVDLHRRAVEFRLTPSAEIWIRPSDVQRGYFMPEATSYEIFRQPGEYGLGAALRYLRAEFLYGLSVGIDVSKERSLARGARVAEIEALTGRLTGPARETDAEAGLSHRWDAVRGAVARRPERLEVWARDLDSVIDFTPARFTDGVQFALRQTALHRAPVLDKAPKKDIDEGLTESSTDFISPPRIAGLLPSKVTPELEANPRHHPQGLSGGALWPVESLNLFRMLLQAPQSNGGAIEAIALSPIGGDAAQKAEFLGGKVTIISQTRNGYVERQQVEVLGRICAFWHRAKHVVVYERTVNPSAQFAPKFKDDPKRTRSRRPILRKVREYIELLQPERNYPDFSTAAQRSAGFLERVRFNSRIINVDSAWASEVSTFGWEIPLWNRLSARERPQVYPMPDVAFVSTAEGDAEKPVVAQECLDPDYLVFFADFSTTTTADTDTWVSRLNLDFPNMPKAQAIAKEADARSSKQPGNDASGFEKRRPSVNRILPGLRRFTWRVAPAAQKAAINAGRAEKPVYAGLDSVSFMRATHTAELKPELETLLVAGSKLAAKPDPELIQKMEYWTSEGAGGSDDAKKYSGKITALKDAISNAIKEQDVSKIAPAVKGLVDEWNVNEPNGFPKKIRDELKPRIAEVKEFLEGSKFGANLVGGKNPCDKLKDDAVGIIKRKEMLVRTALRDWTADAESILPKLEHPEDELDPDGKQYGKGKPIKNKAEAINSLLHVSVQYLRPLFEEASQDVGKAGEGVEKARAVVLTLETELEAALDRALRRIEQFVAGYDRAVPWSDQRRKAFHAGLLACASNIEGDAVSLIDEARQHFASELNDASQAIGGYLAKALGEITRTKGEALSGIGSLKAVIGPFFTEVRKVLDALVPEAGNGPLDKAIAAIDKAATSIAGNASIKPELKEKATDALSDLKSIAGNAKTVLSSARIDVEDAKNMADARLNEAGSAVVALAAQLSGTVESFAGKAKELIDLAQEFSEAGFDDIKDELLIILPDVDAEIGKLKDGIEKQIKPLEDKLVETGKLLDFLVESTKVALQQAISDFRNEVRGIEGKITGLIDDVQGALGAVQLALGPQSLLETAVRNHVLRPTFEELLKPLTDDHFKDVDAALKFIREKLFALSDAVAEPFKKLDVKALGLLQQVSTACNAAFDTVDKAKEYLNALADDAEDYYDTKEAQLNAAFGDVKTFIDKAAANIKDLTRESENLIAAINAFDHSVRGLQNDLARSTQTARMYGERVFSAASRLDAGGLMAAPSNILKLYSAVTTAPEIAALKADIDRIRSGFDELSDIVETTKANALFNRLGDELKALGLSLPFDKIGDRLLPANLPDFEIGKVFRNFGGTKLDNLLKGYRIPAGVSDAVRVTHDFDKKQARAWVQVDIDAPMPGRRSLFSVGVFKADFVDMRMTGQVRLEASKDTDKVTETGYGRVGAVIDLVVGGQSMVRFEKFGLNFTRETGLKIEFDPKNIRLNPSFQFIQDFLSSLFPDDIGGLEIIKQNGIPVGVQHQFAIPPISLNFGTSGVSNISISNHFKLLAFPDFMLANRFNLSTMERPFIFSIFVIGGAGYIQIDAEYRPFDSELMVSVEAGAGGSASLAFAFGPFVGQVFITLSGALTYRKVIGKPGGGLSISAILVIAGHVNVAGLVTVGIVLVLRMTYRDNGQIDADGSLTVTIRISKFFKITARANAKYKMRGGKSETVVTTDASAEITDEKIQKKVDQVKAAANKLKDARN